MILRKPYAILIKYFKLIHILMFIFFGYIVFVLRKIYVFFSEYAKAGSFTYAEGMTSTYVPALVFVFAIILLAFGIGIFLLMRKKDKPVLFYRLEIGYTALLLVAFIYYAIFFKTLDDTVYAPLRIVINRDIILFIYLINYFFVAVTFIRGFGFDIKKFSFDKDKKELNIEETDSEEYEVNVSLEKDDIVHYINKQKRELTYYIKENSMFFTIVIVIIAVTAALYFYFDYFVVNRLYKENQGVDISFLTFVVKDSHLTSDSKYSQVLSKDNEYLVINLEISSDENSFTFDEQGLRIHADNEYYYPSVECDLFNDLGECYKNEVRKSSKSVEYIVVYKIKKGHEKFYLEILKNKGDQYNYSRVLLSPKIYNKEIKNIEIGEDFTIENNNYRISDYEFTNKASYKYKECKEDSCQEFTKIVRPNTGDNILTLEIEGLDKLDDNIINSYFSFKTNNRDISSKSIKVLDRYENKLYLNVPGTISDKETLTLAITMRQIEYDVVLREGN